MTQGPIIMYTGLESLKQMIRVVVIDDHAILRAGLRLIFDTHPWITIVGEAANRKEALIIVADTQPDIVLLDLDLGNDNGFDLLPEVLAAAPLTRIIILTGLRDPAAHRRAVLLGAVGLVFKEHVVTTMLKAIEKVHAGEAWLDRTMIGSILNIRARAQTLERDNTEATKIVLLTDREREVITLVCTGLTGQEIAKQLVISDATLSHHLSSIFSKLHVRDRVHLVVYAYQHGLAQISS